MDAQTGSLALTVGKIYLLSKLLAECSRPPCLLSSSVMI